MCSKTRVPPFQEAGEIHPARGSTNLEGAAHCIYTVHGSPYLECVDENPEQLEGLLSMSVYDVARVTAPPGVQQAPAINH